MFDEQLIHLSIFNLRKKNQKKCFVFLLLSILMLSHAFVIIHTVFVAKVFLWKKLLYAKNFQRP